MATGTPPTMSFTISWRLSRGTEYARWSPLIETPSTCSLGAIRGPASSTETRLGFKMVAIASNQSRVTISR